MPYQPPAVLRVRVPEAMPTLQTLHTALLYMMSHYSAHKHKPACPCLAQAIAKHLRLLMEHPDNADCLMLQDMCSKLAAYWEGVASEAAPRQPLNNASPHPASTH